MNAEGSCDFVMSSTNWTYGHRVWDDGNDLALVSEDELAGIQESGTYEISQLRVSKECGPHARTRAWLGLASIEINVE